MFILNSRQKCFNISMSLSIKLKFDISFDEAYPTSCGQRKANEFSRIL